MTERLYEGQPDRETQKSPLGVHGSLGAFRLVSSMEHSRNSIFSICDSPQKSSAARKLYISGLSSRSTVSSSVPGREVRQSARCTSRQAGRVRRTSSRRTAIWLL